ncbi:DUF3365 domain-containing protein [Spirulina sp. CCNP1310]|uniref:Tll0287-like domain-containing protein n=1 Tax=Spirulina sp. CCNP1310 TaxID=3110249 RepID=UPI002B2059B3|nr:DUF3365 domain-containing protein [Spirulina sp. CCNP1310]MEA5420600.1 DUF3365 domain-containing protein [Spirulina sp. CCNP1310]
MKFQRLLRFVFMLGISLFALGWNAPFSQILGGDLAVAAPIVPNVDQLAETVQEIEALDALRTGLASSLEGSTEVPTMQTMKEVCRPVGMRAMELSQEHGWQVKQMAAKYRNPKHAPDNVNAEMALAKFDQEPTLIGFWDRETVNEQPGTRYYRRINVESSCLVCHGMKERRPQFVKDAYPQDLAYDFNVDDLRGMYAVFIPDGLQKALTETTH